MMRGLWAAIRDVVVSAIAPGVPTWRRFPAFGAALMMLGMIGPLAWLVIDVLRHQSWVALGLDRAFLGRLIVVLAVVVLSRVVAIAEVVVAGRGSDRRTVQATAALVVVAAIGVPCVVAADTAADARADIGRAFEDGGDTPLFDAGGPPVTVPIPTTVDDLGGGVPTTAPAIVVTPITIPEEHRDTTTRLPPEHIPNPPPPPPVPPDSGVDPALLADISTVLLLGGDAGPGRSGLRTDTMILVSIHRPSGRAALISVPRNLERLLFPIGSALDRRYPYGFNDIANAVYPRVSSNESLRNAYAVGGLRPGAVAIAEGIGYSLDVTIDDYVLIDMAGFVKVIDALGGVTVNVRKAVPTPGNPPGSLHTVPPVIEAGVQYMDGTTALAYVRSRKADTDYQRARRQRDVLGALARQVGLADALSGYSAVTSALGDSLRTSLGTDEFTNLLALIGGETAIVESMGLVPPLVRPNRPNYDEMAKIVGRVQLALVTGEPSGY
jgi:LCP family protein required for cell wall assembly